MSEGFKSSQSQARTAPRQSCGGAPASRPAAASTGTCVRRERGPTRRCLARAPPPQAKERAALESGAKARPFYLKEREKKRLALVDKYEELRGSGKLDKFMEKKRRRNASKDHKCVLLGAGCWGKGCSLRTKQATHPPLTPCHFITRPGTSLRVAGSSLRAHKKEGGPPDGARAGAALGASRWSRAVDALACMWQDLWPAARVLPCGVTAELVLIKLVP